MAHTSRGGAPEDDFSCSRNGAPHGGRKARLSRRVAVLALLACLSLAACTSQGASGQSPARSAASGPRITVDMVTHGQAGDPFWALVKEGAQTAAKDFNVKLVYSSPATTNPQNRPRSSPRPPRSTRRAWWSTIPDAAVLSGPIKQAASPASRSSR